MLNPPITMLKYARPMFESPTAMLYSQIPMLASPSPMFAPKRSMLTIQIALYDTSDAYACSYDIFDVNVCEKGSKP